MTDKAKTVRPDVERLLRYADSIRGLGHRTDEETNIDALCRYVLRVEIDRSELLEALTMICKAADFPQRGSAVNRAITAARELLGRDTMTGPRQPTDNPATACYCGWSPEYHDEETVFRKRLNARVKELEAVLGEVCGWLDSRKPKPTFHAAESLANACALLTEMTMTKSGAPNIVCLCGSTRFYDAFQVANYQETMAGRIVLSVGFYPHSAEQAHGEAIGITNEQKIALDDLHKRKIDLADEVFVLNVGGYIGDSTRSEIEYAEMIGKPVRYLESETQ